MSLADRYNRGDGRLELLDRYLTSLGDRAGESWRDRSGASRAALTQGLCIYSAWAATQEFALTHNVVTIAIIVAAVLTWRAQFMGVGVSRGGLIEQIQSEAAGLPKNALAAMRMMILAGGMLQIALAAGDLLSAFAGGMLLVRDLFDCFLLGSALVALQASDYISRTNPAPPRDGNRQRT